MSSSIKVGDYVESDWPQNEYRPLLGTITRIENGEYWYVIDHNNSHPYWCLRNQQYWSEEKFLRKCSPPNLVKAREDASYYSVISG